jgi:hypothetical protein
MNKKALIITLSSVALVTGAGLFFYFRNKARNEEEASTHNKEYGQSEEEMEKLGGALGLTDTSMEYSAKDKQEGSKALKVGAEGRKVAMLQALLNHFEGQNITIDGLFGNQTRFALLKSGFPTCAVASQCEVTTVEFVELLKKGTASESFKKNYSPTTNSAMKAVYDKYKS